VPAGARFCPSCGAAIASTEAVPAGRERRLVTILFVDVTGSTSLGERLDPERLQEVLGTYFSATREEIEAEGGTVEKFIGDAVMAAFGVPIAHEDDPARALRAALRIHRRLDRVNEDLQEHFGVTLEIRTGVNTGEVLASTTARPGEPMVTGDAVNVAARLEQAAEPGQVVVAERTARAARGFRYRELGPQELRGKEIAVPAALLLEETLAGPERGVPGLHAPMVGREQELAVLESVYARAAAEARPNLVTIYGEPGVGKSRLVHEFVAWTEDREPRPTVVTGRCLPYGDGVTYWPLAEILKRLADIRDTDPPDVALERVRALGAELITAEVATDPRKSTAALAYTVGLKDPEFAFRTAEPREVRLKIHAAWRSLFSALAQRSPVVAVIEDIHWADAALLDLLEELADRTIGSVVFLCPARPDLTERRPGWGGGRRNVSSISLEPLTDAESDRLVTLLLSVEDLPASVHQRILDRAEGNPFFLEEVIRHLIDDGRIIREGGRWRASADIADVEIPDTVQSVLAARIDLLAPGEKRALQRAAVVGRVFWPGPVRRLLNGDGEGIRQTLERLEERELVLSRLFSSISGEPEFIFKHVLTRDVAYESLPRRERARAHATVAAWIEDTAGERAGEFVELLAHHYAQAYLGLHEIGDVDDETIEALRAKAFRTLLEGAEVARQRFAVRKAMSLAERALGLADGPLDRAAVLERIGRISIDDYHGDRAWETLRQAADILVEHAPDDRLAITRVCARAAEVPLRWPGSMTQPPSEEKVRAYLDLGFANLDDEETEEGVRLLMARAFAPFGFVGAGNRDPEAARAAAEDGERAAEIAMSLGRPDLASAALDGASSAAITLGLYGPDLPRIERRLELVRLIDDPWELGDIFAMGAWIHAIIGDLDRAFDLAQEGRRRSGDQTEGLLLHNTNWGAMASFMLGDWDTAIEMFREADALLQVRGELPPYFMMGLYGAAAFVLDARAEPEAERLVELLRRTQGRPMSGSVASTIWLAWVLTERGDLEGGRTTLEGAAALAWDLFQPLEDLVWAELLALEGRWSEVPGFLGSSRTYAAEAGLRQLPAHLDRLEGRAAAATGDQMSAISALSSARERFAEIGARFELARTELDLATATSAAGRADEARQHLASATPVFVELGAVRQRQEAEELATHLG
jgi:class 3 adenylate cyclase/tetratricopeptide (TPR) repeat protein